MFRKTITNGDFRSMRQLWATVFISDNTDEGLSISRNVCSETTRVRGKHFLLNL